jgi:hypothetical protein
MTRRLALLPVAAALTTALTAHGQSLAPFYVGAGETLSHEDNLFSATGGPGQDKKSDTISTTSINGGIEEMISRQSVYANASVNRSIYNKNKYLNNTGYSAGTGLNWQTIGDLSGALSFNAAQSLTRNNNTLGVAATTDRNIQRTQQAAASVRWGGNGRLSLQGSYNHRRLKASSELHAAEENTQNIAGLDVNYRVSGALTTGVGVSAGTIDYPRGILVSAGPPNVYDSDSSKRRDAYLNLNWIPNDISDLSARIGYGRTRFEKATQRSVSGPRGQITWNWRPTGKLKFDTSYSQDTSDQTPFNQLLANNSTLSTDSSVLTKVLSVGANYEVTAKVGANASFAHTQRSITNTVTTANLGNSSRSSDSTNVYSLGTSWQATRTVSLGCHVHREDRGSGSSAVSRGYTSNTYSCTGQLSLR